MIFIKSFRILKLYKVNNISNSFRIMKNCSYTTENDGVKVPIYLDNQATTRTDPRVLEEMLPYFTEKFGNPHSRSHSFGWEADNAVENARTKIANLIGALPKEIIFTSGATESNNLALKGITGFYGKARKHVITVQTEHKCVLDTCRYLEEHGFRVTYLPVQSTGVINLAELEKNISPDTILISVMFVNNEIGTIQPIKQIGEICKKHKIFFHCDAAQAFGKIPININEMNVDLMSISGHKIYGPKGIGALYVRTKPRVRLVPLLNGGGQERGFRSGTLPTPLVVGLGKAAEIASLEMTNELKKTSGLSKLLIELINKGLTHVIRNGDPIDGYPGCINLSFSCVEGESLLMGLKDIALSSGSACTSASLEPSYVLRAVGTDEDLAHSSIRFGIGRFTTRKEIEYAAQRVIEEVKKLREMSPLWEMIQDGIDLKSIHWTNH